MLYGRTVVQDTDILHFELAKEISEVYARTEASRRMS